MRVHIFNRESGIRELAVIEPLAEGDYALVTSGGKFKYDWIRYSQNRRIKYNVFKLKHVGSSAILGLVSIVEEAMLEKAWEIDAIECSIENIGKNKLYERIAGCLIAFVCQYSLNNPIKNESGNVILIPTVKLRRHYADSYGFKPSFGSFMKSDNSNSRLLVEKYLK